MILPIGLVAAAYLIGSLPFSYLVGRVFGKTDIRRVGSGNVGATNVLRNVGKAPGVLALLLDILKGWVVVWTARMITQQPGWPWPYQTGAVLESQSFWIGLAILIGILGHMYPVWLRLRGGKGVATAAGAFLAVNPLAIAAAGVLFLIVALGSRYISLASIVTAAAMPLILRFVTHEPFWMVMFTIVIAVIIILKHHENIWRLVHGDERKFPS